MTGVTAACTEADPELFVPIGIIGPDLSQLEQATLATDANFILHDDPAVLDLARQVVRGRLGLSEDGNATRR